MTRINCIPASKLSRQHLTAEYREMLRLRHAYPRKSTPCVPGSYRLGRGHVTFFYNKGGWLLHRHAQLRNEMKRRGYTVNYELDLSSWPQSAMGDWMPDVDAKLRSVARITNRMVE